MRCDACKQDRDRTNRIGHAEICDTCYGNVGRIVGHPKPTEADRNKALRIPSDLWATARAQAWEMYKRTGRFVQTSDILRNILECDLGE